MRDETLDRRRAYRGAGTSPTDRGDAAINDDLEALRLRGNVGVRAAGGTRHTQDGLSDNGNFDMIPFNALEHALVCVTEPLQIR